MNPPDDFQANEADPPFAAGRMQRCQSETVGVLQSAGEFRLVAIRRIVAGERLSTIEGTTTDRPSRYSVQVDENLHVDAGDALSTDELVARHFWRFTNHGCDPNTVVHGQQIIARREIEPGETVSYNYNTTEWDIVEPFHCRCGSMECLKEIRGFKHLTEAQRGRLRSVAPHLHRMAQRESRKVFESSLAENFLERQPTS